MVNNAILPEERRIISKYAIMDGGLQQNITTTDGKDVIFLLE